MPHRRGDLAIDAPLVWDQAGGIVYFQVADPRFFPMVSHEGNGGNVAYIDGHGEWVAAEDWWAGLPLAGLYPHDLQ